MSTRTWPTKRNHGIAEELAAIIVERVNARYAGTITEPQFAASQSSLWQIAKAAQADTELEQVLTQRLSTLDDSKLRDALRRGP